MDGWTYQGIELLPNEDPVALFTRLCRLEAMLGLPVYFQAIGIFRAPMSKARPPRYNPKGQPRQFLHITWQAESAHAWSILLQVAEHDRRALLSSFTGVGFTSKDIDFRDGHPREAVLLAAFTDDAEDFVEPLVLLKTPDAEEYMAAWRSSIEEQVRQLRGNGADPRQLSQAARLATNHSVRYEHGWYLDSGAWRSRYLVQAEDGFMALAAAQDSLCTCASRHPKTLQLMMPSESCVHHLAAKLVDRIAAPALVSLS